MNLKKYYLVELCSKFHQPMYLFTKMFSFYIKDLIFIFYLFQAFPELPPWAISPLAKKTEIDQFGCNHVQSSPLDRIKYEENFQ